MKRSEIELNVTHKSDKKEFKTMKKKIVIALVTIILLILASNIVIHTHLNKSLFQFFFSNNENQESIVKKILTQRNQKIEIDNYIISLEESLCEKNTQLGYLVFSICDKNGNKVESNINDYNKTIKSFGKDGRFIFEYEASGTFNKYAEYANNKLFVYASFDISTNDLENIDLNNCIKIIDTKEKDNNEYRQYTFDLKFSDNCRKYKYNDNILYVSPLGLRLLTNNEMTDLNVVIKGENDNIIKSLSNNDNMFSKSGCKFNGTTKDQYTNQFDDLIDLGMIRNVYINEEELVEIK